MIFLVLVLAGLAAASFLLTWGIQHYRKNLIQGIEQSLGRPVKLKQIGVNLFGGVNVSLRGFAVYPNRQTLDRPAVEIESLDLSLRLAPLLRRRIEIGAIRIVRPKLSLVKDPKGTLAVEGFPSAAQGPAPAKTPQGSSAPGAPSPVSPGLPFSIASLEIQQAQVRLTDPSSRPPLSLLLDQIDVSISNLSFTQPIHFRARLAFLAQRQNVSIQGRLHLPTIGSSGSLEQLRIRGEKVELARLFPAPSPNETSLKGELGLEFQGSAQSLLGEQFSKTLSGKGNLHLDGLTLVNLNLLREIFRQLTVLPGLLQILESQLPSSYREKLSRRDTAFEPIDVTALVQKESLTFDNFRLATDAFELAGRGTIGLDGRMASTLTLRIEPELSSAIVGSIRELAALLEGGRFTLPVAISGTLPEVVVLPDVGYVASRVITQKASDVLGDLLEKVLKP